MVQQGLVSDFFTELSCDPKAIRVTQVLHIDWVFRIILKEKSCKWEIFYSTSKKDGSAVPCVHTHMNGCDHTQNACMPCGCSWNQSGDFRGRAE